MASLSVTWRRVASSDVLRRSSQTLGITSDGRLTIFGGELKPREPVDNRVYHVDLKSQSPTSTPTAGEATRNSPPPRVGSASTTFAGQTYLFSGRGGADMTPLDEQGCLWSYTTTATTDQTTWTRIEPSNPSAPTPPPRSYHAMTTDARDAIYVHAGCPASGRLNDLWVFVLSSKRWVSLAEAPGPPRGGTSIAHCPAEDVLFRVGGFDGARELGGTVDVYNPVNDCWTSRPYVANGVAGPEPRSVAALLCVQTAGKNWLITAFGERDPSALGHAGAGKMLGDVWAYDIRDDAWTRVKVASEDAPQPRGWFAAETLGADSIVVHGGLAEDNERLGDVWVGKFGVE